MSSAVRTHDMRRPETVDVPVLLARERTRELGLAFKFRECAGASATEIEDIIDSTITALLARPYISEEHLFAALRKGVKMRALRLHRDRALRNHALSHAAPIIHASGQARAWREDPERALFAREDDLIISEFLADLSTKEREVFALHADGRSWRAIATALALPQNDARHLTRTCERKRKHFLTLYVSGRLCGSRSRTIAGLLAGELSDERALDQALVHLNHCQTCQKEHHTNSEKLRDSFDARALALLPSPGFAVAWRLWFGRARHMLWRAARPLRRTGPVPAPEHAAGTIAGTATIVKTSVAVVSAALIAGATLSLHHSHRPHTPTQSLSASPEPAVHLPRQSVRPVSSDRSDRRVSSSPSRAGTARSERMPFGPGQVIAERTSPRSHPRAASHRASVYLDVPRTEAHPLPRVMTLPHTSTGGGPFTP